MDYRELPERLDRKVMYESDYVCLLSRHQFLYHISCKFKHLR